MSEPIVSASNALTPEKWKRPDEVMKLHRMQMKKKALQDRMNRSGAASLTLPQLGTSIGSVFTKRKNPFRSGETSANDNGKKLKPGDLEETSSNTTLFKLLNVPESEKKSPLNFSNLFTNVATEKVNLVLQEGTQEPPVDWTLRTKLRFMAPKPFPWNTTLRTCEEASGITGFVRCVDSSRNSSLDTSANAQFHQCCLLWQHPSLPWLELYPRQTQRGGTSIPSITCHTSIKDSLQRHWGDSFRSLYQLVRARQCPYFYFVSNTFTCLFRAAGISGYPHTHVLISPTTRGFRKSLADQEIEFRMPLKPQEVESEDTGYETLDATHSPEAEEVEEAEQWLESMGVEAAEIKRISSNQADAEMGKEKKVDHTSESLVLVEDTEAHVLFNWLLNCKSCVSTTGPLAGVPPTLLAPVAFHGATLHALKVRESKVQVGGDNYYSMELRGPVLPCIVQRLCDLLHSGVDQFSLTLASYESTKAFTRSGHYTTISSSKRNKEYTDEECSKNSNTAFCQEGLSDCGQSTPVLHRLCSSDVNSLQQFDSLKFSSNIYSWT